MPSRPRPRITKEQGNAWKQAWESAGVTQKELAEYLGHKQRNTINDVVRGKAGFYEEEERKVKEYLKARHEGGKPILSQPTTRLSVPELKARYHAEEKQWVDAEHEIPYIAIFPLMDQPPKFFTKIDLCTWRIRINVIYISSG